MGSQIVFRTFLCCLAVFGLTAGIAPPTIAAPMVTLTEVFDPGTVDSPSSGQYIISAGDLEGHAIVGFAVDNSDALITFTARMGWSSDVVSRTAWDAGYTITFNGFYQGSSDVTSTTGGSGGSFDAFFGPTPANQANLYWLAFDEGLPIVDFEVAIDFSFLFGAVADSTLLVFLQRPDGDVFAFVPSSNGGGGGGGGGGTVPEPGTLALTITGLGLFGLARRRRGTGR